MLFTWDIIVPANTLKTEPKEETLKLSAGVVTHIGVKFPAGCHGMVGVRLLHSEGQIMPVPRGEWVTGDDEEAAAVYHIEFGKEVELMKFQGISPGTNYKHTITVRITILSPLIAAPYKIFADIAKVFKRLLGL